MKSILFLIVTLFIAVCANAVTNKLNLESVSTKGLDKNVDKVFNQTRKLIIKARKDKDQVTETLASEQWCLLLHNYHFYAQAQPCYRYVGMLDKKTAQWPYLFAKVSMQKGDIELIKKGLSETLKRDVNYLPAHFYRIKQAIEENQLRQTFAYLDEVPITLRLTSNLLNLQGDLYVATENYHIAIGFYQQALALVPQAKSLNYKIAKAYQVLGDTKQAEKYLNLSNVTKIKLIDPYFQAVTDTIVGEIPYLIKAKTALLNKDYKSAIKLYNKALDYNPNSETALVNMAVAHFQNKQLDLAKKYFKQVLSANQTQQKALYNLAIIHRTTGNTSEALNGFLKLFAMNKSDIEVNYNLASIYYQKLEYQKILQLAEIKTMKTHLDTQYLKAKSLIGLQRYKEALAWLNEINKNVANQFKVVLSLAKLYSQVPDKTLRDPQLALDFAKQAIEIQDNEQSQWQLLLALDEINQCDELKIRITKMAKSFTLQTKNIFVKLVQQRGQDLNCTYIHD